MKRDLPPLHRPAPVVVLPFPLAKRAAKVRATAIKLVATTTVRHERHYRRHVTEALGVHLRSKRVPTSFHAEEIRRFWIAVDLEVARLMRDTRRHGPGGAA